MGAGPTTTTTPPPVSGRLALVGAGRMGTALAAALARTPPAGWTVSGPHRRGEDLAGADAVLLCVPDDAIAEAAAALPRHLVVGHCSGARGLDLLPHEHAFGLHPLMTVTGPGAPFAGAGAALAARTPRAAALADGLAHALGLVTVAIDDEDRAAYHAAASIASNFLVTVEAAAEHLLPGPRELLVPLVRASVESWAARGPRAALTGPIARGDEQTVARQRAAVAERTPAALPLWDALADATRALAQQGVPA